MTIYPIKPAIQAYLWGSGPEGLVGRCAAICGHRSPNGSYAEAWFGNHPNGPASVSIDGLDLPLGSVRGGLPFLAKYLGVSQALSIQLHPDGALAAGLHQADPGTYKDPEAKFEAAIPVTRLELLIGFRPDNAVLHAVAETPELRALLGEEFLSTTEDVSRNVWAALLDLPDEQAKALSLKFLRRLRQEATTRELAPNEQALLRASLQFEEGDVGFFAFLLLNYMVLEPGQCLYIPAGVPHAYLKGELVEVMRLSDNVIRCGLTPKARDRDAFLAAANFSHPPITPCLGVDQGPWKFYMLDRDFEVLVLRGPREVSYTTCSDAELVLVAEGNGVIASKGTTATKVQAPSGYLVCGKGEELNLLLDRSFVAVVRKPQ